MGLAASENRHLSVQNRGFSRQLAQDLIAVTASAPQLAVTTADEMVFVSSAVSLGRTGTILSVGKVDSSNDAAPWIEKSRMRMLLIPVCCIFALIRSYELKCITRLTSIVNSCVVFSVHVVSGRSPADMVTTSL